MKPSSDIVEIAGQRLASVPIPRTESDLDAAAKQDKKFLSVWYRCCNEYGRMYRDSAHSKYEGRCPRCGAAVTARIGADGTTRRTFEAR